MPTTRKSLEACRMMVRSFVLVRYLCPLCSLFFHFLMYPIFSCADYYYYQNWTSMFL